MLLTSIADADKANLPEFDDRSGAGILEGGDTLGDLATTHLDFGELPEGSMGARKRAAHEVRSPSASGRVISSTSAGERSLILISGPYDPQHRAQKSFAFS